jgi:hypothetical protein
MYALKISDNVAVDENDEPEVLFDGMLHAREPMGMEICLTTLHHLLDNQGDPAIDELINTTEIWFLPIINVDGYVYNEMTNPGGGGMWRKNRRDNGDGTMGIDLNRNSAFTWGLSDLTSSPDGSSEVYRGTGPFSEPEMQVMRDFINAHEFLVIINYHSFGEVFIAPMGVPNILGCPDDAMLETYIMPMAMATAYDYGPFSIFGLAGDATCWQYAEQTTKRKAFSVLPETANSFWPPTPEVEDHCQRHLTANLQMLDDIHDLFGRPTTVFRSSLSHLDTAVSDCSVPFTNTYTFWNDDDSRAMSVNASFVNLAPGVDWCTATMFDGIVQPGDSFTIDLDLAPESMSGFSDSSVVYGIVNFVLMFEGDFSMIDLLDMDLKMVYRADIDDGDTVRACEDNCPYQGNNDQADIDGDGVGDLCDNCPDISNSDQYDFDSDGNGNPCDLCWGFPDHDDADMDVVPNACDNCPEVENPGQQDDDQDGFGNACDICPGFDDLVDADQDGNPDGCDLCPGYDDYADVDEDTIPDSCDNCPEVANTNQTDTDQNGVGDACQAICGDANGDGEVNVGDAVSIINYVFKGGAAPDPLCSGDANGDGDVNVADAVYLISYVFKGGPPPAEGCCS